MCLGYHIGFLQICVAWCFINTIRRPLVIFCNECVSMRANFPNNLIKIYLMSLKIIGHYRNQKQTTCRYLHIYRPDIISVRMVGLHQELLQIYTWTGHANELSAIHLQKSTAQDRQAHACFDQDSSACGESGDSLSILVLSASRINHLPLSFSKRIDPFHSSV